MQMRPCLRSTSFGKHYTNSGVPGKYPKFDDISHPVPFNLFDPFGISKKASPEKKAKGLVSELNNGRLAMFGKLVDARDWHDRIL